MTSPPVTDTVRTIRKDFHFWLVALARGFVALLAGSAILVVPDMARTLLLLPIAVAIAVLGLGAYGVIDSALVFVSSFMSSYPRVRTALLLQGAVGVILGVLLLSVVYDRVQLEWFLSLAALQALAAGIAELVVARHHRSSRALSLWDYTVAAIALGFSVTYFILRVRFAATLSPREISWFVYCYLVAFGIAQCINSARMLYADRQALH